MMSADGPPNDSSLPAARKRISPTRFLLRGLAICLPPILTIVILVWIGSLLNSYIIEPTSQAVRYSIAQFTEKSRPGDQFVRPDPRLPALPYCERNYRLSPQSKEQFQERIRVAQESGKPRDELNEDLLHRLEDAAYVPFGDRAVPYPDYREVAERTRSSDMPRTARGLYMELVTTRYFGSLFHLSAVAILLALAALYFIGRLVTVRLGAWAVSKVETGVLARVPLVSHVYSSVKQVTDFFFNERTVEYNRVVAIEYPRRGIWTIAFVTGDSLLEITAAAGEPLVTVLVPTSPMPMTGFTISVPRREVLDLNITIDQAFQFCLSCGVLVPPEQRVTPESLQQELAERLNGSLPQTPRDGQPRSLTSQLPAKAEASNSEAETT